MPIRDAIHHLAEECERFPLTIRDRPVRPRVTPEEIRTHLGERYGALEATSLADLTTDVMRMMREWTLHTTHPRYFGLFNPGVHDSSIVADALAALYNPQLAAWRHAPAASEMERFALDVFARLIGYDPATSGASFTSGGSEANHSAVLAALAHQFSDYPELGVRALGAQPVLYTSAEAHHSFVKIARSVGIGSRAVREIAVDDALRMDVSRLEEAIRKDQAAGRQPFFVVATAGTTGAGAVDPIDEIATVCKSNGLWLHADAAWGGSALLAPSLRPVLAGIERADSVTWDAHKWLSVSMGAGMFFCRHPAALDRAFGIATPYVPPPVPGTIDAYQVTMQWSRRFTGLKVFMALAEVGIEGLRRDVEHQTAMGERLRALLSSAGWVVVNRTPLPLVCFTHPRVERGELSIAELVRRLDARAQVWVSEVALAGGRRAVRACITSFRTAEEDLQLLMDELELAFAGAPSSVDARVKT